MQGEDQQNGSARYPHSSFVVSRFEIQNVTTHPNSLDYWYRRILLESYAVTKNVNICAHSEHSIMITSDGKFTFSSFLVDTSEYLTKSHLFKISYPSQVKFENLMISPRHDFVDPAIASNIWKRDALI